LSLAESERFSGPASLTGSLAFTRPLSPFGES